MNIRRYGWDALLLDADDPPTCAALLAERRDAGLLSCTEIVPAARTVLLRGLADPEGTARDLAGWSPSGRRTAVTPAAVEIPVRWDGPDLADVADRWGTDPAGTLRSITFTVAFTGFAPGFGYLTGLPGHLHLPRLDTPRTRVPAGSVALAGPYAGIYPRSSPGGWRLVGSTGVALFDIDRDPPALLAPGATVRFTDA